MRLHQNNSPQQLLTQVGHKKSEQAYWNVRASISRATQPVGMYTYSVLAIHSLSFTRHGSCSLLTNVRYVLSPTHLHEFKSADKTQAPIMSLYLPEQKLGSHSAEGASSNKFMLKGRQTGSMHRGHSWVFRAESWDTMQAWVSDIEALTSKTPQERNAFVRRHARSASGSSQKTASVSSDGLMDEEDEEPFSASASSVAAPAPKQDVLPRRPQPGGRFPSDLRIDVDRGLQAPLSPSSGSSGFGDRKSVV